MSEMNGFQFEIGAIVTTRAAINEVAAFSEELKATPEHRRWMRDGKVSYPRCVIIERIMQECPGGIQRHYKARTFSGQGYQVVDFLDVELAPIPALPIGAE